MPLVILIIFICLGLFLFIKLRKSKWLGNFTEDLLHEPVDEPETKEVIKEVVDAELFLKTKAKQQNVEIKSLEKDKKEIEDYLEKRKGK